jgi:2-polyprenyl-3-methyl-5-hydroxy-6-metoxy-1,4-benzoquinol methylase
VNTVIGMTTTDTKFDPAKVEAFAGKLLPILSHSMVSYMIDLGDRTGLFAATASGGTSQEIAERAGLQERYVREWLGCMVTSAIVDYDPASGSYALPAEHAALLSGPGSMAPIARANTALGRHVEGVARVFRDGGGIPYEAYVPDFADAVDAMGRGALDQFLVGGYLPLAPGLREKLTAGARVADFACGTGHALVVLAQAFPASAFAGFDLDPYSVSRARDEAAGLGLGNVTFEQTDIVAVTADPPFDAVFMFDALHDLPDPASALTAIRACLAPGGTFILREPHAADTLEANIGSPMAPVQYAVSTLHCLTVSLAHGGAGIGTVFGEGLARRMLGTAGFAEPSMHPAPGNPLAAVYITSPKLSVGS